ncbi:MAG: EI24 domain-containing protein [Rhodospirillales bacterium]
MLKSFSQGVSQLGDGRTQRILWLSIAAAVVAFVLLWAGIGYLLTVTRVFEIGWLEWALDLLGGLATLVLTWFLFPGVVTAVIGFFLDDIADAVEARHYPDLPPAQGLAASQAALTALRYFGTVVLVNLGILVFLVVPPLFPFVFYAANGYLLSREFFELVAQRRVGAGEMRRLRKRHRGQLFVAGVIIMALLTVPVVNLLAPVVAAATMVHLFEGWRRDDVS